MEKAVARQLMATALDLGIEFNKLDSVISRLDSGREKDELIRALGSMMDVLTREFIFRIARLHPELDPDR